LIAEAEITKLERAHHFRRRAGGRYIRIRDLRFLIEDLLNARHRRRAALEDIDDPAHGDDGPDEHDHVHIELDEISHGDAMSNDQVAAGKQRDDHGDAENEFERGPQHAHELDEAQGAPDVLAVEALEQIDL
jgi:hypothetical protein